LRASSVTILERLPPDAVARSLQNRHHTERAEADFRRSGSRSKARFGLSPAWANVAMGALVIGIVSFPVWKPSESASLAGTEVAGGVAEAASPSPSAPSSPAEAAGSATGTGQPVSPQGAPSTPSAPVSRPTPASPALAQAPPDDGTRIKGLEPGLALFRRTPQGAEPLVPGSTVRAGDVLRVSYRPGGFAYGAIFSVDGNGSVTRHWPPAGDRAGRLARGETLLPGAFELDAAPDYERFYLFVSEQAFDLNPVLESLHAEKSPALRDLRMVRFDLLKEPKESGI